MLFFKHFRQLSGIESVRGAIDLVAFQKRFYVLLVIPFTHAVYESHQKRYFVLRHSFAFSTLFWPFLSAELRHMTSLRHWVAALVGAAAGVGTGAAGGASCAGVRFKG